jgi:hypothetical protein
MDQGLTKINKSKTLTSFLFKIIAVYCGGGHPLRALMHRSSFVTAGFLFGKFQEGLSLYCTKCRSTFRIFTAAFTSRSEKAGSLSDSEHWTHARTLDDT